MGLEPTTFELEVQRADPLRHEGTAVLNVSVLNELASWKNFTASYNDLNFLCIVSRKFRRVQKMCRIWYFIKPNV